MLNRTILTLFLLAVLPACSGNLRNNNWKSVDVIAEVVAFEDSGTEKYDFNQQQRFEAATVLKILSPAEYKGTVIRYFHSQLVPSGSCLRQIGAKIVYARAKQAIPGDMGLEYGEIDARELKQ